MAKLSTPMHDTWEQIWTSKESIWPKDRISKAVFTNNIKIAKILRAFPSRLQILLIKELNE